MIDIATEHLITLEQAAARMPISRGGRPCHWATIYRWIKARKLEGTVVGGRWITSIEALQRYTERETLRALGEEPMPKVPLLTKARQRQIESKEREAELIGI